MTQKERQVTTTTTRQNMNRFGMGVSRMKSMEGKVNHFMHGGHPTMPWGRRMRELLVSLPLF